MSALVAGKLRTLNTLNVLLIRPWAHFEPRERDRETEREGETERDRETERQRQRIRNTEILLNKAIAPFEGM